MIKLQWFSISDNIPDDFSQIVVESDNGFGITTFHSSTFKENGNKMWWVSSPAKRWAYLPKETENEFWKVGQPDIMYTPVLAILDASLPCDSISMHNGIVILKPEDISSKKIIKYHLLNY